jgi:hypothetical protein
VFSDDIRVDLDVSLASFVQFLHACQGEPFDITPDNVSELAQLASHYGVPDLIRQTGEWMQENPGPRLILGRLKFQLRQKEVDSTITASLEHQIRTDITNYIELAGPNSATPGIGDELLSLDFPTVHRILTGIDRADSTDVFPFLIACLKKPEWGVLASSLFSVVNFTALNPEQVGELKALKDGFDWTFLNESLHESFELLARNTGAQARATETLRGVVNNEIRNLHTQLNDVQRDTLKSSRTLKEETTEQLAALGRDLEQSREEVKRSSAEQARLTKTCEQLRTDLDAARADRDRAIKAAGDAQVAIAAFEADSYFRKHDLANAAKWYERIALADGFQFQALRLLKMANAAPTRIAAWTRDADVGNINASLLLSMMRAGEIGIKGQSDQGVQEVTNLAKGTEPAPAALATIRFAQAWCARVKADANQAMTFFGEALKAVGSIEFPMRDENSIGVIAFCQAIFDTQIPNTKMVPVIGIGAQSHSEPTSRRFS